MLTLIPEQSGTAVPDVKSMSLAEFNLAHRTDELILSLVHVVLIFLCIVLLHRTASGLKNARFLRHLAWSYAMAGVFYLGNVATILLQYVVALPSLTVAVLAWHAT